MTNSKKLIFLGLDGATWTQFDKFLASGKMPNLKNIIDEEKIAERDFIIRQIPELSSEGDQRAAFVKVNDFKMVKKEKDELNKSKLKLKVKFSLPKGSYATVFIVLSFNFDFSTDESIHFPTGMKESAPRTAPTKGPTKNTNMDE